jgi:hypothetical protein
MTTLERRILTLLEEAGDEHVSALTNTVAKPTGCREEIEQMRSALFQLAVDGLITLATSYDQRTLRLKQLELSDTLKEIEGLPGLLRWNAEACHWELPEESGDVDVVLTAKGRKLAMDILSEEGFPVRPLEGFG